MQTDYIVNKARETVNMAGSRDPFNAATLIGVSVNYKDLGNLRGAYLSSMPMPVIIINENIDSQMKKIVCAHELGHHILHQNISHSCTENSFNGRKTGTLEMEANIFAAEFLIDKAAVIENLKNGMTVENTAALLETDVNLLTLFLSTFNLTEPPSSDFLK